MAGKVIRSVSAKFTADISDFEKKLRSMSKQMKTQSEQMKKFGQAMTTAVTVPLMAVGAAAIKMAMDAQESENLFAVSMGNMAGKARAWSEDLKKSLGLSAYELRKNVSTLNSMLSSMGLNEQASYDMSTSLTKLSADLASFYNISADDALQKLKSGLMGEAEPLKALGVLVNDTTIKTYALKKGFIAQGQEMSEQQKVLARYFVIMEATSKAQGDLARTIDSPTNRLRTMKSQVSDLAIELGNKLMPAFTQLLDIAKQVIVWVQGLVDKFNALDSDTQKNILGMVAFAAAIGPVVLAIGSITTAISTLMASGGVAALAALAPALAAVGVGVTFALAAATNDDYAPGGRNYGRTVNNSAMAAQHGGYQSTPSSAQAKINASASVMDRITGSANSAKAKIDVLKPMADMQKLMSQFGNNATTSAAKADTFTDSVKSMISAIKEQTKSFASFVGLFDVFERKSVSGDRLLTRLKAQIKAMGEWRSSLATLEKRGVGGEMLNDLRAMGPGAVDSIKGLAGLSDSGLREYIGLYGQKNGIAGGEASKLIGGQNSMTTKIDKQINLYTTGSKGDAEAIANAIVKKLRLAGHTV